MVAPYLSGVALSLGVALGIGGAGCRKDTGKVSAVRVEAEMTPTPVRVGPALMSIRLKDASGHAIEHAKILVEGDMIHPGMAPIFSDAREVPGGGYQAGVSLSMGGDWVFLMHIKLPDGGMLEQQLEVKHVRTN